MHPVDLAVILAYVVGCTALGSFLGSGSRGVRDYFVGERDVPAWAIMISIVATETSAVTFLSVPGQSYRGDCRFLQMAFGYILARVVVAVVLLPAYFRGEIETAYQVLARRFGGATQRSASALFLVTRTVASGLRLLLAAKVLEVITGWSLPASIGIIGASTIAYTLVGGIKGVIWADVLQFFVYLVGAGIALWVLDRRMPGGLAAAAHAAAAAGKFRVLDFSTSSSAPYTFWVGVIGALVLDTGSHGVDQMMVQRYLSARSRRQAAWALVASGFVILLQFALFLFLGAAIWAFYRVEPPPVPPETDREFASFIVRYLPVGAKGLVIAAIFSVTMSTASGALSALVSSTINDLYRPLFPGTPDRRLLGLSKLMTAAWGLVLIAVAIGAIGVAGAVVDNALIVAGFVTGILLGLFALGLLTRAGRVGQAAALAGMVGGIAAVSAARLLTKVSGNWYALIGSSAVVLVGLLASLVLPAGAATPGSTPVEEPT